MELRAEKIGEVVEWMGVLERALLEEVEFGSPFRSLSVISGDGKWGGGGGGKDKVVKKKELGKYEKLAELVTGEGGEELRKVIGGCVAKREEKQLAGELVHICEMKGRTMGWLGELIEGSIEGCSRPNTLFRGNGIPEKALTSYCYLVGLLFFLFYFIFLFFGIFYFFFLFFDYYVDILFPSFFILFLISPPFPPSPPP